jgi:hypothetical protein
MMERSFAGFWRDGAVVKPEARHWDMDRTVLAKHKMDGTFDICGIGYSGWNSVYWLDTTTPTELTPQEAFELVKVLYPGVTRIKSGPLKQDVYADDDAGQAIVNWNGTPEYPPRERWRVPTDADKGKLCRFKDGDRKWNEMDDNCQAKFLCVASGKFVIEKEGRVSAWRYCEVLE